MEIIVSPSDLTFLFQLSPWGFYQKYRHGIKRPYVPFPSIFTQIDNIFKETLEGMNLKDINENFPDATIGHSDEWVVSKPIVNEEYDIQVVLRGKIDSMLSYADGTYGIVDYKTSKATEESINKYHLQLSSYAYAMKYPKNDKVLYDNVHTTGLLIYEPNKAKYKGNQCALMGHLTWHEVPVDLETFENFIKKDVIPMLAGDMPKPAADDPFWQYLSSLGFRFTED